MTTRAVNVILGEAPFRLCVPDDAAFAYVLRHALDHVAEMQHGFHGAKVEEFPDGVDYLCTLFTVIWPTLHGNPLIESATWGELHAALEDVMAALNTQEAVSWQQV